MCDVGIQYGGTVKYGRVNLFIHSFIIRSVVCLLANDVLFSFILL